MKIFSRWRRKHTNVVEAEEHKSDFEDVFAVYTSKSKVIYVLLHVYDRVFTLSMQEDTGSDSTLISETMWQQLGCPKLTKYTRRLMSMHDGSHLIVKGILNTVMEYKERYIPVCIKIVDSKKSFGLVGRDVLES